MGGGDLNMKKSWHPLTLQNLERVWKAEQRYEAEQKRIAELQQEIKEERAREEMRQMAVDSGISKAREEKVDFLYRGPGAIADNNEEYLLGKRIDKSIDPTLIEEEREKEALLTGPGSLFTAPDTANSTADLEMKIREDPLFMIKKKEEEAKKKLLSNPVKMKQLQELLAKESAGKKKKKSKKKKSRHHDSDSDSDEEPEHRHSSSSKKKSEHTSIKRERSPHNADRKSHHHDRHTSFSDRGSRYRETSDARGSDKHYEKRKVAARPRSPPTQRRSGPTSVSRKMDPEELERRRNEMMSFAKSRDKERHSKLREHEMEKKKEEEEQHSGKQEQFLSKLRVQSLTSSQSVEDRIHRHINSVQRTKAALNDFMNR